MAPKRSKSKVSGFTLFNDACEDGKRTFNMRLANDGLGQSFGRGL